MIVDGTAVSVALCITVVSLFSLCTEDVSSENLAFAKKICFREKTLFRCLAILNDGFYTLVQFPVLKAKTRVCNVYLVKQQFIPP